MMWIRKGLIDKLLVVLALLVGLASIGKGQQQSCYVCTTEEKTANYDSNCFKKENVPIKQCKLSSVGCMYKIGFDEEIVRRGCMSQIYKDCYESVFGIKIEDGKCVKKEGTTPEMWTQFSSCAMKKGDTLGEAMKVDDSSSVSSTPSSNDGDIDKPTENAAGANSEMKDPPATDPPSPENANVDTDEEGSYQGAGLGSNVDITKFELCFCTGKTCNDNKIKPEGVLALEADGSNALRNAGVLTFICFVVLALWN